jgi:hypothetical protein
MKRRGEVERLIVDVSPRLLAIVYPRCEQIILIHRRVPIFHGSFAELERLLARALRPATVQGGVWS